MLFIVEMARMSESKLKMMKFQEQQKREGKKTHLKFVSEVIFMGLIVDPGKNGGGGCVYEYIFIY